MTNEEMLKVLRDLKYQFDDRIKESKYSKDEDLLEALESNKMASKALDMAIQMSIKTLEQQPCEDAVSRKIDEFELKGKTAEVWIVKGKLQIRYLGAIHNIPLPSVTPKEKED